MGSPTPLLGASSTTQGVLRGRAQGNVFNMGDAEKPVDTVKVTFGCTRVALVKRQPQDNLGLLSP